MLSGTIRRAPAYSVDDLKRDGTLYQVNEQGGALVGFLVLRVDHFAHGAEGVIVAAAGKLAGAALYAQVLPHLERMFRGIRSIRIDACRSGAVKRLMAAGYVPTHFVMRKVVSA